ncbi:hypothetical protein MMC20_005374 [Loxospora ochrophaea]|nr:hypothetical protein [Loxospora ochrophaea]
MSPKPWLLTTPSSRGIGLALTRHLLSKTSLPVVATSRSSPSKCKSDILSALPSSVNASRLEVLHLDVTDESSITAAAKYCAERFPMKEGNYLHLGFLIPGILHPEKSPSQIDAALALETFKINTLGPMLLLKHFSPFLPRRSTDILSTTDNEPAMSPTAALALMSARVGSISDNKRGGWYSYRGSKAAVNQIVKSFDIYLQTTAGDKAMCVGLHPGTVKTGLSKGFWESTEEGKLFSPEFAAERLLEVVRTRGERETGNWRGRCWAWDGEEILP